MIYKILCKLGFHKPIKVYKNKYRSEPYEVHCERCKKVLEC